ncbi:hypothetical protein NL676_039822 [Syzygium grande]|nr:hypothetical protein NL676_039822 [Syzygium grande]
MLLSPLSSLAAFHRSSLAALLHLVTRYCVVLRGRLRFPPLHHREEELTSTARVSACSRSAVVLKAETMAEKVEWLNKLRNVIQPSAGAHSAVVLKAETMAEKVEWLNKLRNVIQPSAGGRVKGESGVPLRQSLSDGSLYTHVPYYVVQMEERSPRSNGPSSGDDWRNAFDAAANGPTDLFGASHGQRISDPAQNGDASWASNPGAWHTLNQLPPAAHRSWVRLADAG